MLWGNGDRPLLFDLLPGLLSLPLAWLAEKHYQALPVLPDKPRAGRLPSLSIVIPARNEAQNLPVLLDSLNRLCYQGPLEILVVDDDSEDETGAIARAHGARVLRLEGPPAGWSGKAYACHRGAEVAGGEWLLFTDADTQHYPQSAALAVNHAQEAGLDGLSLFLKQESNGLADRLALLVAHAGLFVGLRDPEGMLNGQYILLHRRTYEESGGYSTVPKEITEDLALGRRLLQAGFRVPIMRGENAGQVHMYRNVAHMWQGLGRFGVTSLRWTGLTSLLSILFTILVAAPVELLTRRTAERRDLRPALGSWLLASLGLLPWATRFGGRAWAFLAPVGALQVQFAALWGILRRLLGRGVRWKGRRL